MPVKVMLPTVTTWDLIRADERRERRRKATTVFAFVLVFGFMAFWAWMLASWLIGLA